MSKTGPKCLILEHFQTPSRATFGAAFRAKKTVELPPIQLSSAPSAADVSCSAESVFGERRGLERPPPPTDVVAETPNETTASSSKDDSLNSSTASQVCS